MTPGLSWHNVVHSLFIFVPLCLTFAQIRVSPAHSSSNYEIIAARLEVESVHFL